MRGFNLFYHLSKTPFEIIHLVNWISYIKFCFILKIKDLNNQCEIPEFLN